MPSLGVYAVTVAAFGGGGVVAAAAVLTIARRNGALSPLRIVLAGTAVSAACSAASSLLIFKVRQAQTAQSILFWLLGGLAGASWSSLLPLALLVDMGGVILLALGRHLNALLAGYDTAAALGVDVHRLRRRILVLTTAMTASAVAVSGVIGFVGLLLPHLGRFLVGADYRRLFPVCALLGGRFWVLVDIAARTVAAPQDMPIGILTAALGAPDFLWSLARADRRMA